MSTPETQTNDTQSTPKQYTLSVEECQTLRELQAGILGYKARCYELSEQLEQAEKQLALAQEQANGALGIVARSHGFKQPRISPDMTVITEA